MKNKKLFLSAILLFFIFNNDFSSSLKKPLLRDFSRNIYSQWGEDGIIEEIFKIMGIESKNCIEFGATDGLYFSNTANLWRNEQWKAILIESDFQHYHELAMNTKDYQCTCLIRTVGFSKEDSLESILSQIGFDEPIDLLSIDIDGNDYYIFQNLQYLKPRVIICEYNPTFPTHMDVYSKPNNFSGCSVGALNRIAKLQGYTLVAITDTNCFFVVNKELDKFADFDLSLERMRIDTYLKYLVTDYRGNYKLIGSNTSRTPYGFKNPTTETFYGEIKCYDNLEVKNHQEEGILKR